ncbi:MAG: hypothetical protein IPL49_20920 [Saprospirales bacterium]|nr:hypothetical protein [Saprospirales bacterium]MBK8493272.1 hypothetical protein [Saprospirales bacterium]
MRLTLAFCLLSLLGTACQNGENVETSGDFTGYTLEKIPGSSFQRAYKMVGDRLLEEGQLLNGQKNGTWVTYHGDIKNFPKVIATYVNGVRTGPYMEVNEFGQFIIVAQYLNDQLNGRVAKYNFTRLSEELYYQNGVLDGPYTLFFENSDIKQRTAEFKNGVENGWVRYYNEEGKITVEYEYRNGEKVSGGIVAPEESQ